MRDRDDHAVRELVSRYGPGASVRSGGEPAWVVGYDVFADGAAGLWLSRVNPAVDYDGALAARFAVCPECLTNGGDGHDHREAAEGPAAEAPPAEAPPEGPVAAEPLQEGNPVVYNPDGSVRRAKL